jgi:hypothetical protein
VEKLAISQEICFWSATKSEKGTQDRRFTLVHPRRSCRIEAPKTLKAFFKLSHYPDRSCLDNCENCGIDCLMNTFLIDSVPKLELHSICIHQEGWRERFFQLIRDKKPISYDVDDMPNLARDIKDELGKYGYRDLILESNQDRHFLISD